MKSPQPKSLTFIDLGRQPYRPVWEYQRYLQRLRIDQQIPDTLLFVEHDPVYTIGKNGTENHVIASESFLESKGIEVVQVDRGGDVTYHGPGQLVGYPIFDLNQHKKSVSFFMRQMEAVFIEALKIWHIDGRRNDGYTGVWVEDEKMIAMGVRISRWVTMHGFAMNVNPQLEGFSGIIPCGIFHAGVTSLEKHLGHSVEMASVKEIVLNKFQKEFEFTDIEFANADFPGLKKPSGDWAGPQKKNKKARPKKELVR